MFNPETFCERTNLELLERHDRRAIILCPCDRIESTLLYLKSHEEFSFLSGLHFDKNDGHVFYWLEKIDSGFGLGLKSPIGKDMPSVSSIYPAAGKIEGEAKSRLKIEFKKSVESSLFERVPLGPAYQSVENSRFDETALVSPNMSSIFGPLGEKNLDVKSLEAQVVESRFRTGLRRRFTSGLEGMGPWRAGNSFLKLGGFDGFLWSSLFFRGLEAGNGISVPDKALAVRMIFNEFGRLLSHIEFCSNIAFQLEAQELYFKSLKWCQLCVDLMAAYSGNTLSIGVLTYGGVNREPPSNWFAHCIKHLLKIQAETRKEISNISKSRFWKKTVELAPLEKSSLFKWSIAGSALRSSGVNYDMRKARPYDLYHEVDFDVPIGVNGTLYDRILVRMSEIVESIGIINQLLDNLPTGKIVSGDVNHFSNIPAPNENKQAYSESARGQWHIQDKLYHSSLEGPNGLCHLSFRMEGSALKEVNTGMPDINLLSCLEEMLQGQSFEDLGLVLNSLPFDQRSIEGL